MTIFTNKDMNTLYGDWLTTTNAGAGLSETLQPVQDALGNSSPMKIATNAVDFSRIGKTFSFDGVNLTANVNILNSLCGTPYTQFIQGTILNSTLSVGSYNVLPTDCYIRVLNVSPITITLPAPGALNVGQIFIVKDQAGVASTHNITVNVSGGLLIDANPTFLIDQDYGCLFLISSDQRYSIISYYHA